MVVCYFRNTAIISGYTIIIFLWSKSYDQTNLIGSVTNYPAETQSVTVSNTFPHFSDTLAMRDYLKP